MATPDPIIGFDFDSYLDWESQQSDKHEFVRGGVFAMAGARREHATVTLNLASAFRIHLRGGPCRAYTSDMKLRVEAADSGFYPDVMVTCDRRDQTAGLLFMRHALLVVEVLSESTAAYDRGDKFADYRKLDCLREYVVVDIAARRVECFRRNAENHWVLYEFAGEGLCEFASIDLAMPLAAVFEDVDAAAAEEGEAQD